MKKYSNWANLGGDWDGLFIFSEAAYIGSFLKDFDFYVDIIYLALLYNWFCFEICFRSELFEVLLSEGSCDGTDEWVLDDSGDVFAEHSLFIQFEIQLILAISQNLIISKIFDPLIKSIYSIKTGYFII